MTVVYWTLNVLAVNLLSDPIPSNVVPFGVWYGFLVRTLIRTAKKVLHWRV